MKVLIIGGSGGLSGELARQLLERGNQVWAVTRGIRKLPEGVKSLTADRNNEAEFRKVILDSGLRFDTVYDCICMNENHAGQDLEVISRITSRLIVVSTDSVYCPYHKEIPQGEEGVFIEEEGTPDTISYGANKRRMEKVFILENKGKLQITMFRPGHIYGDGFKLGCFPEHSRQDDLARRILAGEPLKLVGMGTYIIQPIFVGDLARVMIDCAENDKTYNQIFCIGGPQRIENRKYYEIVGKMLGREVKIREIPLEGYLEAHPEYSGHLCHRIYDLSKLEATGIRLPETTLEQGLKNTIEAIGNA